MRFKICKSLAVEYRSFSKSKHYFLCKIVLIFFLILTGNYINAQTVQWINPPNKANSLFRIKFFDNKTGFAVGDFGTVLKTTDCGDHWFDVSPCISNWLMDLCFISLDTAFICGDGIIMKTTDGGLNWEKLEGFDDAYFAIGLTGQNVGFIAGWREDYITTNRGASWNGYFLSADYKDYAAFAGDHLYYTSWWYDGITRSCRVPSNYGYTMDCWELADAIDFHFINDSVGSCYSPINKSGGYINTTFNNGDTWDRNYVVNDGIDHMLYLKKNKYNTTDYYIGSGFRTPERYGIFKSVDRYNWERIATTASGIKELKFLNDTIGFAVGSAGLITRTFNGGNTWESCYPNDSVNQEYHEGGIFITDEVGLIGGNTLRTEDGGKTWNRITESVSNLFHFSFPDSDTGYSVSGNFINTRIMKTTNGGLNWNVISPDRNTINDVCFVNTNEGYACGGQVGLPTNYGFLMKTYDGGLTWNDLWPETNGNFRFVYFINKNIGFTSRDGCGCLYRTYDGGNSWDTVIAENMNNIKGVCFDNENNGFLYNDNRIFVTNDTGNSWNQVLENFDVAYTDSYFKNDTCYVLYNKYDGDQNSTILRTTDLGETWDEINICNVHDINSIIPAGNNTLFLTGNKGEIIKVHFDSSNGFESLSSKKTLRVMPNPVISCLQISEKLNDGTIVRIFDINGKMVMEKRIESDQKLIDVSNLTAGVYIIQAINKEQNLVSKFIKM